MKHLCLLLVPFFCFASLARVTTVPYVYMMNLESGAVLLNKNGEELIYPASTTKIATALYILAKGIDLDEIVVCDKRKTMQRISPKKKVANHFTDAPYLLEHDGVMYGIKYGEELSVRDLLHILLLASANDAANVLAEHVSGSIERFCEELNAYVQELGLSRTHFVNPHGLHHPEHVSTPKEMCFLAKKAMEFPIFAEIVNKSEFTVSQSNKQKEREIRQGNKLVVPSSSFYDPRVFGVKTGNHLRAGKCLVCGAEYEGRKLLVGLFKAKDSVEVFGNALSLFDVAFREKPKMRYLFRAGETSFQTTVDSKILTAHLDEDVTLTYYPSEAPDIQTTLLWHDVTLPVASGDPVATLRIRSGDVILREAELVSHEYYAKERSALGPLFFCLLGAGFIGGFLWYRRTFRAAQTQ